MHLYLCKKLSVYTSSSPHILVHTSTAPLASIQIHEQSHQLVSRPDLRKVCRRPHALFSFYSYWAPVIVTRKGGQLASQLLVREWKEIFKTRTKSLPNRFRGFLFIAENRPSGASSAGDRAVELPLQKIETGRSVDAHGLCYSFRMPEDAAGFVIS